MNKGRVMVVEDEGVVALQIRESLEGLGYTVPLVALSGEEAVEKLLETEPDLILMDIKLTGGLSGIEAARKIRGLLDVPVVYLTAFSDRETLELAKVTDPYGYILKPFDEKSLNAIIEMSLSRHRHAREARESGRWMSAIAESMTEAVLICDGKGYVKFINPAAEQILGRRLRDVQEMRMRDIVSLVDAETRSRLLFPVTEPLLEGRSTMRGNCRLVTGDEREYPVEFTALTVAEPRRDPVRNSLRLSKDAGKGAGPGARPAGAGRACASAETLPSIRGHSHPRPELRVALSSGLLRGRGCSGLHAAGR